MGTTLVMIGALFSPSWWQRRVVTVVRGSRRARVFLKAPGRVHAGRSFVVGPSFDLARGRTLTAGDRVSIGRGFDCLTDAVIGDDVMISASVAFVGNDHGFDDPNKTIHTQGSLPHSTVRLEGDNLIGYGTIVVGTVTVGRGAIVGAGSLVTRDLPPETVCVGRPARPVKSRYDRREGRRHPRAAPRSVSAGRSSGD
jgi:chloramphenicol O-acetyltransferase type B